MIGLITHDIVRLHSTAHNLDSDLGILLNHLVIASVALRRSVRIEPHVRVDELMGISEDPDL